MKFLIVGLGNPGNEYAHTRHNIGFDVANAFVIKHKAVFRTDRLAYVAELKLKGKKFVCICPTTYMNLSGKAVKYWMDKESIPAENILVIVDEVALPLNKLRLRPAGSDGGHNGLKSIHESLGTTHYPRLRFGIGKPPICEIANAVAFAGPRRTATGELRSAGAGPRKAARWRPRRR